MSSTQGTPPSTPVLTGAADAAGLGNPTRNAPTVTPPNAANFQVPQAGDIQSAIDTLRRANVNVDQAGLQGVLAQQQELAGNAVEQMQNGAGPGGSAAGMEAQTGLQNASAQANASMQGMGGAVNPAQAMRGSQQQLGNTQAATIAAGAAGKAQEQQQLINNAQNALSAVQQGTLAGASQRLQAQIAESNIQMQALERQMQLSMQELKGRQSFEQMADQIARQNRADYLQGMQQSQQNMMTMIGAIFSTAGTLGAATLTHLPNMGHMDYNTAKGAGLTGHGGSNNPYDRVFKQSTLGPTAGSGDLGGNSEGMA